MVYKRLKKFKLNKAPGIDNITPKVLIFICKPLSIIFNASLSTGVIPKDWKRANVSVIFKKGSKQSPSNYRPISLTSQVCKVLESEIRDKIVKHLSDFKLIKDSQHDFVKNRCCLTNLLDRMIPSLKGLPYNQRLNKLNVTTLETRHLRVDLIEVFKIVKGFDNVNSCKFF